MNKCVVQEPEWLCGDHSCVPCLGLPVATHSLHLVFPHQPQVFQLILHMA